MSNDHQATLALRLAGPLQSWGTTSKFTTRTTGSEPSKSGVVGLLAAAKGIRRHDSLEPLLNLKFGVRLDRPGERVVDFHTAVRHNPKGKDEAMPLTYRHYLSDAEFLACVQGSRALIEDLAEAVQAPRFAPFLGRRSCPAAGPLLLRVHDEGLRHVLESTPWLGARNTGLKAPVKIQVVRDAENEETNSVWSKENDAPISFDSKHRRFDARPTVRYYITPPGTDERSKSSQIDYFAAIGGDS